MPSEQYVTEIVVSVNQDEENKFLSEGYIQNPVNLNKESTGGKIFLWYKKGSKPITRIQLSFNDGMYKSLKEAGYQQVYKNLNQGAGGDEIYLWYYKGSSENDIPIKDLFLSTQRQDEAQLFPFGWEKLACNFNRGNGGCRTYLWVKRAEPTYIRDVTVTTGFTQDKSLFNNGYIRLDEDINRGAGRTKVFIWYRLTSDSQKAIRDLMVTDGSHPPSAYENVKQNLNPDKGTPLFLCYTKQWQGKPVQTLSLIIKKIGKDPYIMVGVKVLKMNLNDGNEGAREFLCFYQ